VVVDARRHEVLERITLGGPDAKPMGLAVAPDGRTVYVTTGRGRRLFAIDVATSRATASVDVGERPWGIAIAPDGRTLYTANGPSDDVSVIDVASLTVVKRIKVGQRPWGVAVMP
jgi:YVTN family beta-propeller protein